MKSVLIAAASVMIIVFPSFRPKKKPQEPKPLRFY